jgi:hypothetical protein
VETLTSILTITTVQGVTIVAGSMEIAVHGNAVISVFVTISYVTPGRAVTGVRGFIANVCNVSHVVRYSSV